MNLLCFLGAVGLSVASGSGLLPDYAATTAPDVAYRSLYSFAYSDAGTADDAPCQEYAVTAVDDDSIAVYLGWRFTPQSFPGVIDVSWVLEPSTTYISSSDLGSRRFQVNYSFVDLPWRRVDSGSGSYDRYTLDNVAFRDELTDWDFDYVEFSRWYGSYYNPHPWINNYTESVALSSSSYRLGNWDPEFGLDSDFVRATATTSLNIPQDLLRAFDDDWQGSFDIYQLDGTGIDGPLLDIMDYVKDAALEVLKEISLFGHWTDSETEAWSDGYDTGKDEGRAEGYQEGLRDGADGVTPYEVVNFYDVFSMIISTPLTFLYTSLDTEIFSGTPYAFNPGTFVISILIVLMIWRIVVMVIGIKNGG